MSNDEQNNGSDGQASSGIDALDSILAKESAKASDEREQITQTLKAQEEQRLSEEKAELDARRNALLAERQEAIRRRQSQLQQSQDSPRNAPPVDAETQRMIPGSGTGVHKSKRLGLSLLILCLLGGGVAFGVMKFGPKDTGSEGKLQGATSESGNTEAGVTNTVIATDVQDGDAGKAPDAKTASSDAGTKSDSSTAAKDGVNPDAKIVIAPKPKPRVVNRRKPRRSPPKPKPAENGGGIIKLRQGLGGR